MERHVIKLTHEDGFRITPKLWCGATYSRYAWHFQSAQHVALAVGGSVEPCKACIRAIIKALETEL